MARRRTSTTVPASCEVIKHRLLIDWTERKRTLKSRTERILADEARPVLDVKKQP
jgi:hypothetical protein